MRSICTLFTALAVATTLVPVAPAAPAPRIIATVGPGPLFVVENVRGAPVKVLRAGRYAFLVRDRSNIRNFHLFGPGVDKRTPVKTVKGYIWFLNLRKGTYRYRSDPQARSLNGTIKVV